MCKQHKYNTKGLIRKLISGLMAFEGFSHIIVSVLSLWGIHNTVGHVDFLTYASPIADLFFGVTSLYTSYFVSHENKEEN